MSQYLQFRGWLDTSAAAEKKLAAAVVVLVAGLVGWALVPTTGPGGGTVAAGPGGGVSGLSPGVTSGLSAGGGGAAGGAGAAGAGGAAAGGGSSGGAGGVSAGGGGGGGGSSGGAGGASAGGGSGGGGSSGGGTASTPCGKLASTDTGVTPTQIKVAAILLNLAGAIGNSAVAQPSPQVQQQMAQAVVDEINAHGGVACRKLVVAFYEANPIDPASTHNVCLQIQQAGVFAVIGGFAFPQGANDCLAQQKIPVLGNIAPTPDEAKQYYPYLMSVSPDPVQDFKNAILGLRDRGWFTAGQGFKKLSILEDDCSPEINHAVFSFLLQAGITSGQITKNEFSCPSSGFASPSEMSNFATQDNLNHVTNVVFVTGGGSSKEYSDAAKGQNYKPRYLVADYQGFLVTATGSTGPDPANFDGTIATTTSRFGESNTPGLTDPATQACIALFARHGLPASYITGSYLGGGNCNLYELFAAAARDPAVTRASLAAGLGQVGRFNEAYPASDSIYKAPGPTTPVKVTGGDFWWTIQFSASCTCWKVIDPTVHPGY
ncbi:MAG: type 1 periplasmic-binding domain-containing protein [Acidimicrobiales bacterium]